MDREIQHDVLLYQRKTDACMDLKPPIQAIEPGVVQEISNSLASWHNQANAAFAVGGQPAPQPGQAEREAAEAVRNMNNVDKAQHQQRFSLNVHPIGLLSFCLTSLTKQQRERMQSTMTLKIF